MMRAILLALLATATLSGTGSLRFDVLTVPFATRFTRDHARTTGHNA